ncbi:hypothetical protein HNY73_000054 [Argiope bruennichi]|uniref:Uncharacterized protein n=1 Tax=Argiope bruennichi TaxID=94029 RepID=A0A8T0FZ74_ARGBR|nr:hypothetical protein HNY73_000054 [Argiope bruennichi]
MQKGNCNDPLKGIMTFSQSGSEYALRDIISEIVILFQRYLSIVHATAVSLTTPNSSQGMENFRMSYLNQDFDIFYSKINESIEIP